jgi:hypothetical protein
MSSNKVLNIKDLERIFYQRLNFNLESRLVLNAFYGIAAFVKNFLRDDLIYQPSEGRTLCLISTFNQEQVMTPIIRNLGGCLVLNTYDKSLKGKSILSLRDKIFGMALSPRKIKFLINHPHLLRDIFWFFYAETILERIKEFIIIHKISRLIVASDHGIVQSLFTVAIRELKVKSYYIQHGMVTEKFPALEYDYFFAYGERSIGSYSSLNKSIKCLPVGKVYAIKKNGIPNMSCEIGLSINMLDCMVRINDLIDRLKIKFPDKQIIVRPHPRLKDTSCLKGVIFRGPIEEYFANIAFHIAGDSSIHLDSIFYDTPTYYSDLLDESYTTLKDGYGFLGSGLVESFKFENSWKLRGNDSAIAQQYIANIETKTSPVDVIIETILHDKVSVTDQG